MCDRHVPEWSAEIEHAGLIFYLRGERCTACIRFLTVVGYGIPLCLAAEDFTERTLRLIGIVETCLDKDHGDAERLLNLIHILNDGRLLLADVDDDLRID